MQYGSIGWAVGALLGYAQALKGKKRVIASIGDGSFQVTAQVPASHPKPYACACSRFCWLKLLIVKLTQKLFEGSAMQLQAAGCSAAECRLDQDK